MNPRIRALHEMLEINTLYFLNCLDGVTEEVARRRPTSDMNNMAYLGVHMVETRHDTIRYAGAKSVNPYAALLEGVVGIDDVGELPPLSDIRKSWNTAGEALAAALSALSDSDLDREGGRDDLPVADRSLLSGLSFLLEHESFHIGQLSFLRQYFGLGRMRYREEQAA